MHRRIAALFISFAVTSLVMLVGWDLAHWSTFSQPSAAVEVKAPISPPALQPVAATASEAVAAREAIASR